MNLEDIMLSDKKASNKGHIVNDSIYKKFPEQTNYRYKKADGWSSGAGRGMRVVVRRLESDAQKRWDFFWG